MTMAERIKVHKEIEEANKGREQEAKKMQIKIIKQYDAKLGTVTVTEYTENGRTEYKVKHTHPAFQPYWTIKRTSAIMHAQFLAGKY